VKRKETHEQEDQLAQLVKVVLKSAKYKNVCEDLIGNIGLRELLRRKNLRAAIKSTKNKLHQIGGAYFLRKPDYGLWLKNLKEARVSEDEDSFRRTCARIMSCHYSTRERLSILDEFYTRIFALLPPTHSIMDIGCGFHPLSISWMPLSGKVEYYAYDVYTDLTDFLNSYFLLFPDIQGYAEARDVLRHLPENRADLAFILNTIPCFEQINRSDGAKILESTKADFLVISFPTQTLGGREKDMRRYYEARFMQLMRRRNWRIQKLEFRSEIVFIVMKQ